MVATLASLAPAYAQYGGPALLTRGQAPSAMSAAQIDFRPFLSIDAGYTAGLNGVSVDINGNPNSVSSTSLGISAGVSGLHSWKHTMLGLDYRASLSHYNGHAFFDGTNQSLMLGISHQLTRHAMVSIRESAGISSQSNSQPTLQQTVPFDPSTTYLPTHDFFDNRTIYLSTQIDLRIQRSTRLSYNIGVDGFLTRYRSTALYGTKGWGARGDVQYRASRRSTIGAAYNYTHYAFHGVLSSTDAHGFAGTYAISLSRTLEFSSGIGVAFYETKFQREVPIDPVVAAIICPPPGPGAQPCLATQLFYGRNWTPNITARLAKTIPRGVLFVSGGHSIIPGNGLFLTSTSSSLFGGYSYTGLKRWSVNTNVGYSLSDSVGNVIGKYSGVQISSGVSRQIMRSTHFIFGFNASKFHSPDFNNYNRWVYGLNIGLGFAPGDIPIRMW